MPRDHVSDGVVRPRAPPSLNPKGFKRCTTHQSPLTRSPKALVRIDTDIAFSGDSIGLTWRSGTQPYLFALPLQIQSKTGDSRTIAAERAEDWSEGVQLEAALYPAKGEKAISRLNDQAPAGASWHGRLALPQLAPGRYRVHFEVKSRRNPPEIVARMEQDLRVLQAPFEDGGRP